MKKLLTCLVLLISLFVTAQTPNISYTSQNVYVNSATTITPTNTGGLPTQRTRVSTFAGESDGNTFSNTTPNGFTFPMAVTTSPDSYVYAVDDYWPCIRKIFPNGITSVLAGKHITENGSLAGGTIIYGYTDGQGTNAEFNNPKGLVTDSSGNIYIADTGNHRIRKITPSGLVTTIAGDGTNAELDGQGINAQFSFPYGITIDSVGNLYVIDLPTFTLPMPFNTWPNTNTKAVIRKIDTLGNVTTLAGNRFGANGGVDGQGTAASFKYSLDITCDSLGNIYVADTGNYKIRKITPTGLVSTIYYSVGISPSGIEIDSDNNIYFGDLYTSSIRRVDTNGVSNWPQSTYYAGAGYSNTGSDNSINGLGPVAQFYEPHGITIDSNKNLFIADRWTQRIRKVTLLTPYTISPNLPAGLTFDPLTGIISGSPTSISPSTQYTITASNYSGTSTTTITLAALTTTCASSTTWNGSSWSNGAPTLTVAAQIDGPYVATTATSFSTCDLLVNSTLTINNNAYVEVLNDITVDPSGTLLVQSGGKLIPKSDTSMSYGIVTVQRTTPNLKLYDYTYWSSPVNTIINTALIPTNWWMGYTFTFNTQNFFDIQTQLGTVITPGPDGQDDDGNAWTQIVPTTNFIAAKGYASMVYPSGTFPRTETVSFTGILNTGIITYPLVLSANGAITNDDFNLVGNPYSASIFADNFINANINNISGTLNFWSHTGTLSSAYPGLAQLNFSPNDYAYYNLSGGVNASFGGKTPSGYISSGQGFMLEAENAANLEFKPSLMAPGYLNDTPVNFFRTNNNDIKKYRVSMSTELGLYSQQLVNYNSDTTLNYEKGWDFKQPEGRIAVKFYSIQDTINYKIQARGDFDINDVVKIGYFSAVAETYTVNLDAIEGIENVYIKDNGVIHELPYTFTTEIGEFNDRFELVYLNNDLGIDPVNNLSNLVMIPNPAKDKVEILFKELNDKPITMYNMLGQQIETDFRINDDRIIFNIECLSDGIYLIKINNTTLKLIKK